MDDVVRKVDTDPSGQPFKALYFIIAELGQGGRSLSSHAADAERYRSERDIDGMKLAADGMAKAIRQMTELNATFLKVLRHHAGQR